jgi:hypothetical protein
MQSLLLHPTPTAQWQAIVHEAQDAADRHLDEALESYLVFLLMRFTDRPQMVNAVLALEFLNGMAALGSLRQERLRDVGDQCLIYSGLFPRQAERRCVNLRYFVGMGQTAYQQLSDLMEYQHSELFARLARAFVALMDVLQMIRELGDGRACLDPLRAMESWSETGSRYALHVLEGITDATPVALPVNPDNSPVSH